MKNYELDTIFTFGKYKGYSLQYVFELNPGYIQWCILNLEHFNIEEDVFGDFLNINPNFKFSEEATNKLQCNWEHELDTQDYFQYDEPDYDRSADWEQDTFDALTDGQYGSYYDFKENGGDWDSMMDGLGY
jgi:hypothetical protein